MNLEQLSIRELTRAIREKKIDLVDLVEHHLARIDKYNSKFNALVALNPKLVRQRAKQLALKVKRSELQGRLIGIPFSAKHNIPVKGFSMSDGSRQGFVKTVTEDAPMIELLTQAGALCIGKGNMAEYGKSSLSTESALFGRSCNPFDVTRSPGGSTGGDAAAMAAGLCSFSIGGDSGGSLRGPANFCGLYSILPTRGVILERGLHYVSSSFNRMFGSSGPLARSLDDLEIVFDCLQRLDPLFSRSVSLPLDFEPYRAGLRKFAFFSEICGIKASKEIRLELAKTAKQFEQAGYEAVEVTPRPFEASLEPFIILAGQAGLRQEDLVLESLKTPRDLSAETSLVKNLRERLSKELPELSADSVLKALSAVDTLRDEINICLEQYAFILAPVCAGQAPGLGSDKIEVDAAEVESYLAFQFSRAVNLLGLVAVSFPTSIGKNSLPLGLQIIGPRFSDRWLIQILRKLGTLPVFCPRANL